jgi:hypothetical protein
MAFKHAWQDRKYKERKQLLAEYKISRGCADCKGDFTNPSVLTFDHISGKKEFGIGQRWSVSLQSLLEELEKCEVVCHNCHAVRTCKNLKDEDAIFEPFKKIPRLFRDCTITEKIDGTNATVVIDDDGDVYAASRNSFIPDERDNFGFRGWVESNEDLLRDILGPGVHRGEWWGSGIQRKYGLTGNDKRFSLFHPKWEKILAGRKLGGLPIPDGLGWVPILYQGPFLTREVEDQIFRLRTFGSVCSPGFMDPEGVVVYHEAAGQYFKVTVKDDEKPKGSTE